MIFIMIKIDKVYQAPAKVTNAKVNLRNNYQNTGEKESGLLALIEASNGLPTLVGKRKYR